MSTLEQQTKRRNSRAGWLLMFASLGGAVLGFFGGGLICTALLHIQGRGSSHVDLLPVVASCVVGMFVCAVAFPIVLWAIVSRRSK